MQWRWLIMGAAAIVVVGGSYIAWRTAAAAGVGAAAIAKVECSCVFVEGRTLAACRADDPPGFENVGASVDEATKTVTGSVFGIIKRRASVQDGYGCVLEP